MSRKLLAGTSRVCITPPQGINIVGGFGPRPSQEVVDDLYSNALVLNDGEKEIAFVSVDVAVFTEDYFLKYRDIMSEKTGIQKNNIFVAATHTHTAASIGGVFLEELPVDDIYATSAWRNIVSSVIYARNNMEEVYLGVCSRDNRDHVHNRRHIKPDGRVIQNWSAQEYLKDSIEPDMVDPELLVMKLVKEDGSVKAFLINYAMHNNALAAKKDVISADFAGYMADQLRRIYGSDVAVLFMPGAGGDTNVYSYQFKYEFPITVAERYKYVGRSFAGSIMQMDSFYEYQEIDKIRIDNLILKILERPYTELDEVDDLFFGDPKTNQMVLGVMRKCREAWGKQQLEMYDVPINIIAISDELAIVTVPGELFVELGLEIKNKSPYKYTMVWELTNGYYGYIPALEDFEKGGYETRKLTINSFLGVQAGEKIVEQSIISLMKGKE